MKKAENEECESSGKKSKPQNDEAVDFSKVDFSQYKGGAKKSDGNSKEFNPWKDYDKKGKSSKAKQRYKPAAGKSVSYKK
jgi:hypothetical protein